MSHETGEIGTIILADRTIFPLWSIGYHRKNGWKMTSFMLGFTAWAEISPLILP
jgi:hypothetical protein